jgi:hypothetical protein
LGVFGLIDSYSPNLPSVAKIINFIDEKSWHYLVFGHNIS